MHAGRAALALAAAAAWGLSRREGSAQRGSRTRRHYHRPQHKTYKERKGRIPKGWRQLNAPSTTRPLPSEGKIQTVFGPRDLKSGYWQALNADDELDIFDFIGNEDLCDAGPVALTGSREVAAFSTSWDGSSGMYDYDVPVYRCPKIPTKMPGQTVDHREPLDQDWELEREFNVDIVETLKQCGKEDYDLSNVDIVTSLPMLRILVGFIDESLVEDLQRKGYHTYKGHDAEHIDMARITRIPEAPNTIFLGTVWNWVKAHVRKELLTWEATYKRMCAGLSEAACSGAPSNRFNDAPLHYRLIEYKIGELRCLVRVPVIARIPDEEAEDIEGHGVELLVYRKNRAPNLWDRFLSSKYAIMELGDIGLLSCGVNLRSELVNVNQLTKADIELDRPEVPENASYCLGRLEKLLQRIHEVCNYPGARDRHLYLSYSDAELRVISPRDDYDPMGGEFIEKYEPLEETPSAAWREVRPVFGTMGSQSSLP